MYLGFAATGTVLSGQAINSMFGIAAPEVGIVAFGTLTAVAAIVGYRLIHVIGRISTVVGIFGFGYLAVRLFATYDVPATFWTTFAGTVLGAQGATTVGVLVAACAGGGAFLKNQVGFMGALAGPAAAAVIIYLVIVTGKLTVNCLNAYGGFMSVLTTVSAFNEKTRLSPRVRALYIVGFVVLSLLIALAASADFLNNFKNFVLLLLAAFVPWSAVNLVDYYLVSRERVDIPALYDASARYGSYNWMAIGC